MKNEFKITGDANIAILKILKFVLVAIVGYGCIVYYKHSSIRHIYLLVAIGFICLILLFSLKSYKVIGKITFVSDKILINSNKQTIELPFDTILRIVFHIKGLKGISYRPSLIQPVGANLQNTINFIEIEMNDKVYKLNILLEYSVDLNSIEFQIDRLIDLGLKVDKVILPKIINDFT